MAKRGGKDFISKLADAGEDVLQKASEIPGADRLVSAAAGTKKQLDELTKKVRGLDALEKRVAALERKVAAGTKPAAKKKAPAKRSTSTAAKKKTT